jgi:hypothetical protein
MTMAKLNPSEPFLPVPGFLWTDYHMDTTFDFADMPFPRRFDITTLDTIKGT